MICFAFLVSISAKSLPADGSLLQGDAHILFLCVDGEQTTLALCMDFDLDRRAVSVWALPPDAGYPAGETSASLAAVYLTDGLAGAMQAVSTRLSLRLDRGIACTAKQFVALTEKLGDAQITVPESVSFTHAGAIVERPAGPCALSGEDLYEYLLYGATGDVSAFRTAAAADMLRSYFNPSNAAKGETLFETLINGTDSDITAYDFAAHADTILAMSAPDALTFTGCGLLTTGRSNG